MLWMIQLNIGAFTTFEMNEWSITYKKQTCSNILLHSLMYVKYFYWFVWLRKCLILEIFIFVLLIYRSLYYRALIRVYL